MPRHVRVLSKGHTDFWGPSACFPRVLTHGGSPRSLQQCMGGTVSPTTLLALHVIILSFETMQVGHPLVQGTRSNLPVLRTPSAVRYWSWDGEGAVATAPDSRTTSLCATRDLPLKTTLLQRWVLTAPTRWFIVHELSSLHPFTLSLFSLLCLMSTFSTQALRSS